MLTAEQIQQMITLIITIRDLSLELKRLYELGDKAPQYHWRFTDDTLSGAKSALIKFIATHPDEMIALLQQIPREFYLVNFDTNTASGAATEIIGLYSSMEEAKSAASRHAKVRLYWCAYIGSFQEVCDEEQYYNVIPLKLGDFLA